MSETIWTFETARFKVELILTACDSLDLSWCETGETAANLDSGLWTAFDSEVRVSLDGRAIASDYLGQSIYEDPTDFGTDHRKHSGNYFTDMVSQAVKEARDYLANAPAAPQMRESVA